MHLRSWEIHNPTSRNCSIIDVATQSGLAWKSCASLHLTSYGLVHNITILVYNNVWQWIEPGSKVTPDVRGAFLCFRAYIWCACNWTSSTPTTYIGVCVYFLCSVKKLLLIPPVWLLPMLSVEIKSGRKPRKEGKNQKINWVVVHVVTLLRLQRPSLTLINRDRVIWDTR